MAHEHTTILLDRERREYFAKKCAFDAECKKREQELKDEMEKERAEMKAEIEKDRQRHRDEVERREQNLKYKEKRVDEEFVKWEAAAIKAEAQSQMGLDVTKMELRKRTLEIEIRKIKKEAAELASSFQPAKKAKTAQ